MQRVIRISLGLVALASAVAFTRSADTIRTGSSFNVSVDGAVTAAASGLAVYGSVRGDERSPAFTISLGGSSAATSILFTRQGGPLTPGTYPITDENSQVGVRALVMTGSAHHPGGVFRADSGVLTVTAASDSTLSGEFRLRASGFLAGAPDDEGRRITASGRFDAVPGPRQ